MAEAAEIKAAPRTRSGTGGARAVRRTGDVPGVVYGEKGAPETIVLSAQELKRLIAKGKFLSTVFNLDVGGRKSLVIPREVQVDPVRDFPLHVDFQRVSPKSRIRVKVPVRFINEALSPGLKRGGVLNVVRHEVEVFCPVDAIPEHFEFSLEGLEIGRSVHISATRMPEGVRPTITNRDFTVATIAGHRIEEEAKPAEAATVEGVPAPEGEAAPAAPATGEAKPAAAGKEAAAKAPAAKAAAGKEAAKAPEKGKR
jgi:large subunit ribosomal protein L25